MNIYTARYTNKAIPESGLATLGITLGYPRHIRYRLSAYEKRLAPDPSFKNLSDKQEFKRLYTAKLDALGGVVLDIIRDATGDHAGVIMLCYEDLRKPELWCHRRMLASWLYIKHGIQVLELSETPEVARLYLPQQVAIPGLSTL